MLPIILGHEPGGGSTRTVIHFAQVRYELLYYNIIFLNIEIKIFSQEISSGRFCAFDFGDENVNMEKYNSSSPPGLKSSYKKEKNILIMIIKCYRLPTLRG